MRIAVYPGTFDPVTNGHVHIVERACRLFDRVIIAVAANNYKDNLFTLDERMAMMRVSVSHLGNAEVESFTGLAVDYAESKKAQALIRGLRAVSDFEYEMSITNMNKHLNENLDTLFLMTSREYSFLSSSIIKQVGIIGGDVSGLVPPIVAESLQEKFKQSTGSV